MDAALSLRPQIVIAGLTRNPVAAQHWIPDQVRDDKAYVWSDKAYVWDDNCRVRDDELRIQSHVTRKASAALTSAPSV
jgi:hypothetical protein